MPRRDPKTENNERSGRCAAKAADADPEARRAEAVTALVAGELERQAAALSLPADGKECLSASRIHAMRIATRRARSALRTFRDALPAGLARLAPELRWLAGVLGAVRDLDVYTERYRKRRAELPPADAVALERYDRHVSHVHASAHSTLISALASERYTTLIAAFAVLRGVLADEAFAISDDEPRDAGRSYVDAVLERVLKRGRRIDGHSSATKLHDLRKEVKRLRYLLELLEPHLGNRAARVRKAAVRLQDVLGEHQDACAAEQRMRDFLESSPDGSTSREWFALGRMAEVERRAARKGRKRFANAWRRFEEAAGKM